jgi:hypothetical protein
MGAKYREYRPNRGISREERRRIHPVWRGVGFVMMILIPVISYAAAEVLLDLNGKNNWFPVPSDLVARRGDFLYNLFPDPMIQIKLIIMIALAVILFALFTWVSFLVIGTFGMTERNDPYYVAPVRRRRRRRI